MKHLKKFVSVLLTMAMVMAMALTAFAAGVEPTTYTITIDNSKTGHTYEAYQIFIGDITTDEQGNKVLSNIGWGSSVLEQQGDAAKIAEQLAAGTLTLEKFLKTITLGAPAGSTTGNSYEISGLASGYYLIKDQEGSLAGADDTYTSYILKVVEDVTVEPKGDKPEVEKKVKDINDSDGLSITDSEWVDSADHDVNDEIPFQLTGTLPTNYADYKQYYYHFNDTMSEGLTFKQIDTVYILHDDDTTTNISGDAYAVATASDGFTVTFEDLKQSLSDLKATDKIVIEYTAELNENAVIGSEGNPNTVDLTYSNNPNQEGDGTPDTGETPEDTVIVFTYKVVVNKVDENSKPLAGAEFTLYKYVGTGVDGADADGYIAIAAVLAEGGTQFAFERLDDGEYKLEETTTPEGYNTISPIKFKVTAAHTEGDEPVLTSLSGEVTSGEISFTSSTEYGSLTTTVENKSGTTLPETGGIGTTIFYVIGSILVLGASVVMITRKRMAK